MGGRWTALTITTTSTKTPPSKRQELLQILSNVTGFPIGEIRDDSTLDDLGIESLMATEVLNDIRLALGLTIDLSSFLFFPDLKALAAHVDEKLGVGGEDNDLDQPPSPSTDSGIADVRTPPNALNDEIKLTKAVSRPTITSAVGAF